MSLTFVTLDVFTTNSYGGNPVAIVHVPASQSLRQDQKQLIAREFNLSESVFLHEQNEADRQNGDVRIDIFTVFSEVPWAGHPTVGVSNYLLRHLKPDSSFSNISALQAKAGRIPIELTEQRDGIQLRVAHNVHVHQNPFPNRHFSHYPVVSIVKGMTFILAQVPNLEELAKPTQNLLGTENTYKVQDALDDGWRTGIVTSYFFVDLGLDSNGRHQIRSRMFGSREDPATGSAASALCSYLSLSKKGDVVRKYQVTQGVEMGRKSDISIQITLNATRDGIEEVLLSGSAVMVMEGKLDIPN